MHTVTQSAYRARILLSFLLFCAAFSQAQELPQERVGLVLAGGGARGIAHVGVIQALEELQVPLDAIAGTSMGALVGGLYATGMDGQELQGVVSSMDWEKAFVDKVPRSDLPIRRKGDDYDYPTKISMAFKDGQASFPLGLIQGQQVRMIIKELVEGADHVRHFDQLPIPYRAVATDIETGEAYVFDKGSLVTAMRASMSIPGLLAPVSHDGRLLVDGGLANNVPVDVARSMGVDRLITVDIGTPLRTREEIRTVVSVADQMLGFLTRRNSLDQIATLTETDILVRPVLEGVGMLDFDNEADIVRIGYEAAMAMREELSALSLNDTQWAAHLGGRALPVLERPVVEYIAISNDSKISDEIIRERISQPIGTVLELERLRSDIAGIYAMDYFELIDFEVVEDDGRMGLLITATEKSWGSDDFKVGLNLLTDLDGTSDFNVGASYRLKGLNRLGAEFYGRGQLGDTLLLNGEFYQPLDLRSRFFVVPYLGFTDRQIFTLGPEFELDEALGAWRVRDLEFRLTGGVNLFKNSQLRLGVFRTMGETRIDVSSNDLLDEGGFDRGGYIASFRYDNMDDIFFPRHGGFLFSEYAANRSEFGSDEDFERWQALVQGAFSFGADKRHTVILTGRTAQSRDASNSPQNYYQLGGLFNLSGLRQDSFSGRQLLFAMGQYQYRLSQNSVVPLDMPVYAGFSAEGGELWSEPSEVDFGDLRGAGSIYLAIDSPIGPIYLAYGRTTNSQDAVYLSLGWPFLGQNANVRR